MYQILIFGSGSVVIIPIRLMEAEIRIPKACMVDELLSDPEIQIVLNLTIRSHAEIAWCIGGGKKRICGKPLAIPGRMGKKY
jgi:hypothetical protein